MEKLYCTLSSSLLLYGRILKSIFIAVFFIVFQSSLSAQVSLTTLGSAYTQNFDGFDLGTIADLPANWAAGGQQDYSPGGAYSNTGSYSNSNSSYSLRNAATTDYAWGAKVAANGGNPTGSGIETITLTVVNNTGSTITSFDVSWVGEQYSQDDRASVLRFSYSINGGAFTDLVAQDVVASVNGTPATGNGVNLNPITSTSRSTSISSITLLNGQQAQFRFAVQTGAGSDNNAHIGVDDFSLTPQGATCSDGIQNGDETGVDCGGSSCPACPPPPCTPPTITDQPDAVTKCAGEAASFTVAATGTGTLSYQWQEDGNNLSNGGVYSGVNTATLNISDVTGLNGKKYKVIVTTDNGTPGNASDDCSITSDEVTLTVNPLPTASVSAATSPICAGENAVFNLTGTANAEVTYNINSGGNQTTNLDANGDATVTVNNATANQTLNLVSVKNTSTNCSQNLNGSATVTVNQPATVEAGNTQTICQTKTVDLTTIGASIGGGASAGVWSTSGDGTFTGGTAFGSATAYVPGTNDKKLGVVTLILTTTDAPTSCPNVADQVEITILKVDCGAFPWNGN